MSQWINLYFDHAMNTNATNNIGAEDCLISIVDNNKKLLEIQITKAIIQSIVDLCKQQNRDAQLIQLLKAICSCKKEPIVNNQNDIARVMLDNQELKEFLMMPVRINTADAVPTVEVTVHALKGEAYQWMPLGNYKGMKVKQYGYFLAIIDLAAELCLGRNGNSVDKLQEMYSFDTLKIIVKDRNLPFELRSLFMRILLNMHMNREPLEPIQIPS